MSLRRARPRGGISAAALALIVTTAAPALAGQAPASTAQPNGAQAENPASAPPASAPVAKPAANTTSSSEADPPQPAPAPAPAEAIPGYFRVDTDSLGTQLWFGATHKVGAVDIASDVYLVGTTAELDVGVTASFGGLALTPMAGIAFDFDSSKERFASLVAPQLFTTFDTDRIHFESWVQFFWSSLFADGAENDFYTRDFLLYRLGKVVAIGPQVELTDRLNSVPGMFESGLTSLPIGGRINLAYGNSNTLGIFVGYDTKAAAGADGVAGRFTFVRTW